MKTKILSLLLVTALILGAVAVLSSCGNTACEHPNLPATWEKTDDNKHQRKCPDCDFIGYEVHNFKIDETKCNPETDEMLIESCSACGSERTVKNELDPFTLEMQRKSDFPWDVTELVMSICDNSNVGELESGGRAYISGEWDPEGVGLFEVGHTVSKVDQGVLDKILNRNQAAMSQTKVHLTYQYMGAADGAWNTTLSTIARENAAANTPDVYYNFIYHMVGGSIKGYFRNIQGNEYLGPFYQAFSGGEVDEAGLPVVGENGSYGYNWDYMKDLSFSSKAMYLIASDYSFDIARAYFIMPVNGTLLQNVTEITGDVNEDGVVGDELDFLAMVNNGDWTWTKIAAYTEAIKTPDSTSGGYSINNSDCVAGFAMSLTSGLCSAPVMYTGDLSVVTRSVHPKTGEYFYDYSKETPQSLINIFKMAADYIGTPGAGSSLNSPTGGNGVILYDGSSSQVDAMFAKDRLFVNTAVVLGIIESQTYQDMWNSSLTSGNGFVVTPAAKTSADQESYRTLVHNIGKVFAVSSKAGDVQTDAACAFINYQTVNSSDILKEYYTWSLGYSSAVTDENVLILMNMSNNIKYGVDKVIEDAFGIMYDTYIDDPFNPGGTMHVSNARLHIYMCRHWDAGESITSLYEGVRMWKILEIMNMQDQFIDNIGD